MLLFIACLFPFFAQIDLQPEASTGYAVKKAAHGKTMMVASASDLASRVGFSILEEGGNAIDAAIAIQIALTLVEPHSSGIGGGGVLLYYSKHEENVYAYDGRETAPRQFTSSRIPPIMGGKSVGVPGVLKMLELAHQEWGILPWKELFKPTIKLAEDGFLVSHRLSQQIERTPGLSTFAETREYLFENGKAKPPGSRLKNPALAKTLRLLAEEGTAPFYTGKIAQNIVRAVQNAPIEPGFLSLDDLAQYKAIERRPLRTKYHHYQIYGFPPPSSGGIAVAQILGMLADVDLKKYTFGSPSFIDLFSKASRAAYSDRQIYVGDPRFVNVPIDHILSPNYIRHLLEKHTKNPYTAPERPSTSQICVVDGEGNAISFTTSIEYAFGSALMVDGFFLNNQLTDFSLGPNRIEPGKRPMSSMSPSLVFDDNQLILAVGSAGGARIIDYVAQTLLAVLDFGLNIQEAISFPNFTSLTDTIDLEENTFLPTEKSALKALGNTVRVMDLTSGTQGIQVTPSGLIGGVDPRRDGLALGE